MIASIRTSSITIAIVALACTGAHAQQQPPPPPPPPAQTCPCPPPAPPPPIWTGSAGFGVTLNRGNTDTTDINLSFDATRDPKTRDVWKLRGLYQRGERDGEASADRLVLQARYERSLNERLFVFAELPYLRDKFKSIDYHIAPNGGIGYKLVTNPRTTFSIDGGFGAKWEKNPGLDVKTSAVVTAGDRFELKLTPTSTITQSSSAVWDADDFGEALYTFSAGLAAAVTAKTQLKIELLDAYATRPPAPEIKKNDVALLATLVYKF
jgi:putative salt-induced outer membrane protein YdiY